MSTLRVTVPEGADAEELVQHLRDLGLLVEASGGRPGPQRHPGAEEAVELYRSGNYRLRDLAAQYGVTHQAVSLWIKAIDPGLTKSVHAEQRAKREAEREAARRRRIAQALSEGRRCKVCWGPQIRNGSTCSAVCGALWRACRYQLDPAHRDLQIRRNAEWVLAHPDHPAVDEPKLRLARKIVDGEPIGERGRWTIQGSASQEAAVTALGLREKAVERWGEPAGQSLAAFRVLVEQGPTVEVRTCEQCGSAYEFSQNGRRTRGARSGRRFCSPECYRQSRVAS